jgi:adenylate kinase (isozyme 1 subfamily)
VLGGPGSGKGTQCEKLVRDRGYVHLSAGDLLRDEVKSGSELGQECQRIMKEGKLVPPQVIIRLLREAMERAVAAAPTGALPVDILIDGFPRALDQAGMFERSILAPEIVLFFDCPEEVMEARLLKRGETSGRADDNAETIRKRFRTFVEQSLPVVESYEKRGKAVRISATSTPDEVYAQVLKAIDAKAAHAKKASGGRKAAPATAVAANGNGNVPAAPAVPMVAAA